MQRLEGGGKQLTSFMPTPRVCGGGRGSSKGTLRCPQAPGEAPSLQQLHPRPPPRGFFPLLSTLRSRVLIYGSGPKAATWPHTPPGVCPELPKSPRGRFWTEVWISSCVCSSRQICCFALVFTSNKRGGGTHPKSSKFALIATISLEPKGCSWAGDTRAGGTPLGQWMKPDLSLSHPNFLSLLAG